MDINSLARQFTGRKFGELVLEHHRKMDLATNAAALQGAIEELPHSVKPHAESWIDEIAPRGVDPSFWRKDCGTVLLEICDTARRKLASDAIRATDDQLLAMFQIIVLNFAYGAHKHPQSKAFIQQSVGMGFLRRLFS